MAIALGNHTKGRSSGSSVTGDATIATTAGATLYVAFTFDAGASVSGSITDVAGNTFALAGQVTNTSSLFKTAVYVKQNAAGHAANNVTVNFTAAAFPSLFFGEITGAAAASLDVAVTAAVGSASLTLTSGALAQADELILYLVGSDGGTGAVAYTETGGPTLTAVDAEGDGTQYWTGALFRKIVASTASTSATIAASGAGATAGVLVSLKQGTGAAAYTLTAGQGSYSLTGQDAGLLYSGAAGADLSEVSDDGTTPPAVWSGYFGDWSFSPPNFIGAGNTTQVPSMVDVESHETAARIAAGAAGFAAYSLDYGWEPIEPAAGNAYSLVADQGSYAITGSDAVADFAVTASAGAYTLTGQDAILSRTTAARTLTAAQGSLAITGQAAGMRVGRSLTAAAGSYSVSGQAATPRAGRALAASSGTYALTGQATGLRAARRITAAQGAYSVTGQAAGTRAARTFPASQGTYAVTGQPAALRAARAVAAAAGAYALTGQPAGLNYSAGPRSLLANQGTLALTGQAAGLRAARRMTAAAGTLAIAGQPAGLRAARLAAALSGSYAMAGQAATLSKASTRQLVADAGAYALTGRAAGMAAARRLQAGQGAYTLAGKAAGLATGLTVAIARARDRLDVLGVLSRVLRARSRAANYSVPARRRDFRARDDS